MLPDLSDIKRSIINSPALFRIVCESAPYRAFQYARLQKWAHTGQPIPPPTAYKQTTVRAYGRGHSLRTLVETGTFLGQMINAVKGDFDAIYSIELDPELHRRAKEMFARFRHIHLLAGDSSTQLVEVLGKLRSPALFWLDAHYSGEGTACGAEESPIAKELDLILGRDVDRDVILIDDSREFNGSRGYPTVDEIRKVVRARRPHWQIIDDADIIRIHR